MSQPPQSFPAPPVAVHTREHNDESASTNSGQYQITMISINVHMHMISLMSFVQIDSMRYTSIAPYIYDARYHSHPYILSTTVLSDIIMVTPIKEICLAILTPHVQCKLLVKV